MNKGKMKPQPLLRADAAPDGGLNLAGTADAIGDNEAAFLLNLWHDGRALRLRPGLRKMLETGFGRILDIYPKDGRALLLYRITNAGSVTKERSGVYIITEKALLTYDGQTVERVPDYASYDGDWSFSYTDYAFTSGVLIPAGAGDRAQDSSGAVSVEGDRVNLLGSGYFLTVSPLVYQDTAADGSNVVCGGAFLCTRAPYVPTLYTGCEASGAGTANEARNLLTPKVKMTFTTDAGSTAYNLCDRLLDNDTVTAVYNNPYTGGSITLQAPPGGTVVTAGGITLTLDRTAGRLTFSQPLVNAKAYAAADNLEVSWSKTVYAQNPLLTCRVGIWFGESGGANGTGSRVFLAGGEQSPNTVYFSGADTAAYFPEDGLIHVGDPTEPVTAFGRQYDVLVVFKATELYTVSCESSVGKPLFLVKFAHGGVGCDTPASVQTVNNRLTWAHSGRGVFHLRSTQIKDERAVEAVSDRIFPLFAARPLQERKAACALCDKACYYLFCGAAVFVWRYACDGEPDAFFYWELPHGIASAFRLGDAIRLFAQNGSLYALSDVYTGDDGEWFDAYLQSKSFDFGLPACGKQVRTLLLQFADGGEADVFCGADAEAEASPLSQVEADGGGMARFCPPFSQGNRLCFRLRRRTGGQNFSLAHFTLTAAAGPRQSG